jgi:hypothetical protein
MERKVGCLGNSGSTQRCLELRARLKTSHCGLASTLRMCNVQKLFSPGLQNSRSLDSQTLAALGAACVDHGAATAGLHANQKTMGTGAADFGGLVSAFHVKFLTGSVGIRTHSTRKIRHERRLIAPNTIRGTRHYRKLSESRQHLRLHTACNAGTCRRVQKNVDKVLINYNPARSKK